jgi:adenylate kinase
MRAKPSQNKNSMLNLILFGPPGAGKGTQSAKLIEKYNLLHIATGDLFRKHLSEGSELGLLARKYMDEGHLVPDEVVIGMVDDKINENGSVKGIIFDGFPRTVAQAEALDALLNKKGTPVSCMIALEVPHDELRERIKERSKSSGRVDDQNDEKINTRIQVYEKETFPVAKHYATQNKLHKVNGVGTIDGIFDKISSIINSL